MSRVLSLFAIALMVFLTGCTRIETGEVGVRTNFNKQVVLEELPAGSWNQTMFGEVNTFPVRDLSMHRKLTPQAGDNSTLKNFEYTIVFNIQPGRVADLWATKSRSWHAKDDGDILLMWNYVANIADNAAQTAVRKHKALVINDNRKTIEDDIKSIMMAKFSEEKLNDAINVSQVQMNQALPSDDIVVSANRAVTAQNDFNTKVIEVQTAEQEAKRIAMLNSNSKAIEYMQVQAQMTIAEAVKNGKVNTIVIPYDFKGLIQVPSK